MLAEQRYNEILQLLNENTIVKTHALCNMLVATRETIRRDFITLEERGLLKRIRGGAMKVSVPEIQDESEKSAGMMEKDPYASFAARKSSQVDNKEAIVKEAVKTIHDNTVIALDSGTTNLLLAKELKGKFTGLTVVTNSLAIMNELANTQGVSLIVTGGLYRNDEEAFVASFANLIFPQIHIDTFYLTTCGISVEAGITYQRMDELSVQKCMMEASDHIIVIADSSKLGKNSLVRMCGIDQVSTLITDSQITAEQIEQFKNAGVNVVISPERGSFDHEQS